MRRKVVVAVLSLAAGLALTASPTECFAQPKGPTASSPVLDPQITRKGEGARRLTLNALELKAFPVTNWAKLTDWQNGSAITSTDTNGKVVLIVTYSGWYKPAKKGMEIAKSLAETYAKKGLIVVAVHDKDGWADAEKTKPADGVKFLLAHDSKNEFRKSIESSQDPDFYLIDKAGNMRFAAIQSDKVEDAVKSLTTESATSAEQLNATLAKQKALLEEESRRTSDVNTKIDMTNIPELPYRTPSAEDYEKAEWPLPPMTDQQRDEYKKTKKLPEPKAFAVPDSGWHPSTPKTKGRVTLLYFFHPDTIPSNKLEPYLDGIDLAQRRVGRDLAIGGVIFDAKAAKGGSEQDASPDDKDAEKMLARLKTFTKGRKIEHPLYLDLENSLFATIKPENSTEFFIPQVAVISSDGTCRWWGFAGETAFAGALDKVLAVDPGARARREAEAAWIKAQRK
ncbi:MAG: redoxin domain-containing protein [Planctomycetota bacterium]